MNYIFCFYQYVIVIVKMFSLFDKGEKFRKQVDDIERVVIKFNKRIVDLKFRFKVKGNCFIVILKKYLEIFKMFCFKDDLIYFDNFEILKFICVLLRIYFLLLFLILRVYVMKKYELYVYVFIFNCICFILEFVSILLKFIV